MTAATAVLGAVLRDNRDWYEAAHVIVGADFEDPRLGAVFDGIGAVISAGGRIDATTVEAYLPEWDVRGVDPSQPWRWLDDAATLVYDAARLLRAESLRRTGTTVMRQALQDLADTGMDPARVLERVDRQIAQTPRETLDTVSLADVLRIPDRQDWVIPGLMERKDRLILTGAEGLGKSTMARQIIILSAAGIHPFTSADIEPVTSLVVDAENTGRQWMRASRWLIHQTEVRRKPGAEGRVHLALSGRLSITDPSVLGGIHRLIDRHKPGLVFIGPLYRLAVNVTRDEDANPVIAALDTIRDRDVALIVEAHAGHTLDGSGQRSVRPRGSSALMGWPEFGYGVRKNADNPDEFDLVPWRGAREERDWPRVLRRGNREFAEWPWMPVEEWE